MLLFFYISFILRKWSNSGVNPPSMCHVYSPVILIRTQIPQSCTCARPFWKNFQFPHLQNAIIDCKRHGGWEHAVSGATYQTPTNSRRKSAAAAEAEAENNQRRRKICSQPPSPAKLQVFCVDDTWLHQTAEEATADMKDRTGHQRDFAEGELGRAAVPLSLGDGGRGQTEAAGEGRTSDENRKLQFLLKGNLSSFSLFFFFFGGGCLLGKKKKRRHQRPHEANAL